MSADRDAALERRSNSAMYDCGVAGVEAASDVGGGNMFEHLRVGARTPGAEALSHVTVEVDCVLHCFIRIRRASRMMPRSWSRCRYSRWLSSGLMGSNRSVSPGGSWASSG